MTKTALRALAAAALEAGAPVSVLPALSAQEGRARQALLARAIEEAREAAEAGLRPVAARVRFF